MKRKQNTKKPFPDLNIKCDGYEEAEGEYKEPLAPRRKYRYLFLREEVDEERRKIH